MGTDAIGYKHPYRYRHSASRKEVAVIISGDPSHTYRTPHRPKPVGPNTDYSENSFFIPQLTGFYTYDTFCNGLYEFVS